MNSCRYADLPFIRRFARNVRGALSICRFPAIQQNVSTFRDESPLFYTNKFLLIRASSLFMAIRQKGPPNTAGLPFFQQFGKRVCRAVPICQYHHYSQRKNSCQSASLKFLRPFGRMVCHTVYMCRYVGNQHNYLPYFADMSSHSHRCELLSTSIP